MRASDHAPSAPRNQTNAHAADEGHNDENKQILQRNA